MKNILSVGMGGVLGALARYYITIPLGGSHWFPVGTFTVNLTGSFLLAFFLTVILEYYKSSSYLVLAVSTGFMGSLTTFSTLSVESVTIAQFSPLNALVYAGLSFIFGFLSAVTGRLLGKAIAGWLRRKQLQRGRVENE